MFALPLQLAALDADALDRLADYFGSIAEEARERACKLRERRAAEERIRRQLGIIRTLPDLVSCHQATGMTADAAIRAAAQEAGVPVETVELWVARERRNRIEAERRRRQTEVMRLAARGWSNAAIAAEVGLHRNSVSRIVQRQLRRDSYE